MTHPSSTPQPAFFSSAIASGYRAAILLLGLPMIAGFFGTFASMVSPIFRFPVQAMTAAAVYAVAVSWALSAWRQPGVGSRLARVFSLGMALVLPLFLREILS